MRQAESKAKAYPTQALSVPRAGRAVPTFIATDLLEKLIEDRDALAVRKIIIEGRRH